ncbi:Zn-dependent peptidase ImmA (M78 family) [Agrobacterium pusense]|uniref:ImmA/IrrE family metallo-endopeptidase n=1 Tax=Agrobacterium TaxID=357 RepID=UPI0013A6BB2D|nr:MULTISPECIES: ImmA/IrrE family metallo-endopeptidase [Agrobacterium]MDR6190356.1 Zn-dependent peptidase ImmA (M78 family) [Agrobacterium pusense]UNZ52615.1 ImmA/IrrE family metallo-endopeptidase [Agrobacterium tumefaciens]
MAVLRRSVSSPRPPREYGPEGAATDARKIAAQNRLSLVPLDVVALAQSLGLKVIKEPMAENTSGYLRREDGGWTLGVNSLHHPNRQRFTIAHEIGHYFLHREHSSFEDGLLFRKTANRNHQEDEANYFASLLLMPEVEFRRTLTTSSVEEAAAYFGVSKQAAELRVSNLGRDVFS